MSSNGESSLEEMRRASMQRNALFKASLGFLATPFEAEAARGFIAEPSSIQKHVAAVERHPGLDGVNPDARLNARWPCREQQIEALAETIGSVYEHCSPIVVHGPSGTGKTSIVRDVMEESGCPYTFIDCKRLQSQRMLLQAILEQLTLCKRLRPSSKVLRSTRHCIWSSGKLKAAQSKKPAKPRSGSMEVADVSGSTSGTGSRKRSASNSIGSSTKSAGSCTGSIADTEIDDAALDEVDDHADVLNDDVDADLDNHHKFFVEEQLQQQQQSVPVHNSRVHRAASIDTTADDTANATVSSTSAAATEHVNSARATSGWQTFAAVLNTFLTSAAVHGNHEANAPLKLYMVFDRAEALTHEKFNSNSCDPHCIHILRVISELRTTVAQSSAAHTRRDNSSIAEHNAAVQQQQQQHAAQQLRLNIVPILITSNGRLLRHQLSNGASTLYVKTEPVVINFPAYMPSEIKHILTINPKAFGIMIHDTSVYTAADHSSNSSNSTDNSASSGSSSVRVLSQRHAREALFSKFITAVMAVLRHATIDLDYLASSYTYHFTQCSMLGRSVVHLESRIAYELWPVYLQNAISICTRHQTTSAASTANTTTTTAAAGTGSSSSRARANSAGSSSAISSISSSSAMSQSDAAKLFDKFQPLFAESINQFYKDTFSAEMIESTAAHTAASNTTASRSSISSSNGSSSSSSDKAHNGKTLLDNNLADTDLSVSARFLLVSAYLASHLPQSNDISLYTPKSNGRKGKKRAKPSAAATAASNNSSTTVAAHGLDPIDADTTGVSRVFPLERLLSIYTAVRCAHGMSIAQANAACTADVGRHIASFVSMKLLTKCCSGEDFMQLKYRCNASLQAVTRAAKSVKLDIDTYLPH
eukprot:6304-Heterococcus_DN1.PRE.1